MKFKRRHLAAIHDIFMAALSFPLAMYLRLGERCDLFSSQLIIYTLLFSAVVSVVFYGFKLYNNIWGYASLKDLFTIFKAASVSMLTFFIMLFLIYRLENIPRSVFIINWLLLLVLLGGPRFFYRLLKEQKNLLKEISQNQTTKQISVLLIGLNNNTELFLRDIFRSKFSQYHILGILDYDIWKIGSKIHNVKIIGSINEIETICTKLKNHHRYPLQKILLTEDYIDGNKIKEFLEIAHNHGMSLAKLPKLTDFKNSNLEKLEIKPLVIEDLLGRTQNVHEKGSLSQLITDKRILVTGCGGTIGGELSMQIAYYQPANLILIDICEYNLYEIEQKLHKHFPTLNKILIIADVCDEKAISKIFSQTNPEIVFHAAALKHVNIVEKNICKGVQTNVLGTKIIADACLKSASKMIMISTDKAVNPTNIMGASKRAAEIYLQMLNSKNNQQNFAIVRFGNVLGSSGSVIPLFNRQLQEGGPLTVTHPEMVRYFMTVREAVELVLLTATIEVSNKTAIFVLDMGKPVKIDLLARQMIQMAGLRPGIDIKIVYCGIRPGEKLYEELFYDHEKTIKTSYEKIMIAQSDQNLEISPLITQLIFACNNYDTKQTISLLQQIVPEYKALQN